MHNGVNALNCTLTNHHNGKFYVCFKMQVITGQKHFRS